MEIFLIYILKSAGLLSIFYICYQLLLRNDTSFDLNRKFLLGGILTSAFLPSLYFTRKVIIEAPSQFVSTPVTGFSEATAISAQPLLTSLEIVGIAYLAVTAVLLLRYFYHLFRIFSVIRTHDNKALGRFSFIETQQDHGPFSFFNYIVYNPARHNLSELGLILKHEKVHSSQFHTLDILIGNLTCCILWFNPLCWLYKKCVVQNLEFIADKETVAATTSKKEYLKTLVKVSVGNLHPALTNSFYQSFIKKRIVMLNKTSNPKNNFWKVSLVIPAILSFMLTFNVQTEFYAQVKSPAPVTSNVEIFIDIDKNTSKKELDSYKAIMNEHDVILNFEEVQYNQENLLANIKVEFIDRTNVSSGSITKSNTAGIAPFRYIYSKEEGSRFTIPQSTGLLNTSSETKSISVRAFKPSQKDSTNVIVRNLKSHTGKEPIYIIDGKVVKLSAAEIDTLNVKNITVLKGASAKSVYGNDARDGAVIMTTKNPSDTSAYTYSFSADSLIYINASQNVKQKIYVSKTGGDAFYKVGQKGFYIASRDSTNNPLYIVDGKKMDAKFEIGSLDKSTINSISVIKGANATAKYGEEAKGGAIEITTKKNTHINMGTMVIISPNSTPANLKEFEARLKAAGIHVDFEKVKRNKQGIITNIKIIAKHKSSEMSASFSETEAIPKIYVGLINGKLVVSSNPPGMN